MKLWNMQTIFIFLLVIMSSASSKISIRDLDKPQLLFELWKNSPVAHFYVNFPSLAPKFDAKKAVIAVDTYIDYFEGRCIKTDLSQDEVNPAMYDRDAGEGAFAKIVAKMRLKDEI